MENSIIVLLVIASVIYKIYSGYKEEIEKAAKRNPQKRSDSIPPIPSVPVPPIAPAIPSVNYKHEQKIRNPLLDIPDEVRAVHQAKLQQQQLKKASMSNQPSVIQSSPTSEISNFDLRQAVIQAAILERPYK